MEKGTGEHDHKVIRVAITGPECTGKSTLAAQLAKHYNTVYVPEYARDFISSLGRPYTYNDILHIARVQVKQALEPVSQPGKLIFFDTYLIITKVWLEVVYGHYPDWIDTALSQKTMDHYLLCNTNIPWVADPVRENGGEMREKLYLRYQGELEKLGYKYNVIGGTGAQRLNMAIDAVDKLIKAYKE